MKMFNIRFINFMMLGAIAAGFASCNNEDVLTETNNIDLSQKEIKLGALSETVFGNSSLSRAGVSVTDVGKFFEGKKICMYVDKVTSGNTVEALYDRQYLTVSGDKLVMPQTLYYPTDGSKVNIYFVAATDESSAVDNSTAKPENFEQVCMDKQTDSNSDFLYAKLENMSASDEPLNLEFKHLGTKISIAVNVPDDSKLTGLHVMNAKSTSTYSMADGSFISTSDVIIPSIEASYADALNADFSGALKYASVYIAPQTIAKDTRFIEITYDGYPYYYSLDKEYTFASGSEYKFNVSINSTSNQALSRAALSVEVVCVNE